MIAVVASGVHADEPRSPLLSQDVMTWWSDVSLADVKKELVDSGLSQQDAWRIVEESMIELRRCWKDSYETWLGPIEDESVDPFSPKAAAKMKLKYNSDPEFRAGLDSCAYAVAAKAGLAVE